MKFECIKKCRYDFKVKTIVVAAGSPSFLISKTKSPSPIREFNFFFLFFLRKLFRDENERRCYNCTRPRYYCGENRVTRGGVRRDIFRRRKWRRFFFCAHVQKSGEKKLKSSLSGDGRHMRNNIASYAVI